MKTRIGNIWFITNTQAHGRAVARTVQPLVGHSESEGKP